MKKPLTKEKSRICLHCGEPYKPMAMNQKYCSVECRLKAEVKRSNPFRGDTAGTTGAISELRVAIDLMSKGFHVFRALSPHCPCDLAVLKNAKLTRIEVRTTYKKADGAIQRAWTRGDDPANIDVYAWVLPQEVIYEPEL